MGFNSGFKGLTVLHGKLMRRSTYIVCLCCLSGCTVFIYD